MPVSVNFPDLIILKIKRFLWFSSEAIQKTIEPSRNLQNTLPLAAEIIFKKLMKLAVPFLLILAFSFIENIGWGQSLTEKLIAEDPVKLAGEARASGNIVRGAILFHQGNINCIKCHRASAAADGIGPDLSRIEPEVTVAFIIESILEPSKVIKKGFETVIVLTLDGQLIRGSMVSEADESVVIRDGQNVDRLITLPRDDIDEIRPGKESNMPGKLADELKDRQQFLDLLRYVIDIKERGPDKNSVTAKADVRRELSPELNGAILVQERNCVACHDSNFQQALLIPPKQAPRLKWSAKWLNPDYLADFIANPHQAKSGTTMPEMLTSLEPDQRTKIAAAIAQFLVAKNGNEYQPSSIDAVAIPRGHELFHAVGCVACHSPRNEAAIEQPLANSTPLGSLAPKYNVDGLVEFLKDPLAVRPSGHMPNMQLTHREATDIANFLLQSKTEPFVRRESDPELVKQGEAHFTRYQCASCHSGMITIAEEIVAEKNIALARALPLEQVSADAGCLSEKDGPWPQFHFATGEVAAIRAALTGFPAELANEKKIEATLVAFNCIACHSRGDLGGVTSDRNPHFQTANLNLGDQGRIPPGLSGVGAKLKPDWMRDVLVNHRKIRPYMKTRMPQYGEANIGHLVELFQSQDQLDETKFYQFADQKTARETGHQLAGNTGLNCVACHTYQFKVSDTMPAVDLTEMAERLKKDWLYQYMLNPQKFSPNTVMPSLWPSGQAINKDIPGSPEEQIEALWQYLLDGRQARMPSGVVREPLEIVVNAEAEMLRRSYPGIGKRGIGVGYPGGINLAYDAEQMRLGMIWAGKFADPGGVWTGQGSGNVQPLGSPVNFPAGPELDSATEPWLVDNGRPPHHQFKGYFLDEARRPTFEYSFAAMQVKDYFSEIIDAETQKIHLLRRVTFTSDLTKHAASDHSESVRFRIAADKQIVATGEKEFAVGKRLKIRLRSAQSARIIESSGEQQLIVTLEPNADGEQLLEIEYMLE